jgi:hypothetical protein
VEIYIEAESDMKIQDIRLVNPNWNKKSSH